ncbi:uncharacterized protein LOC120695873 [Panicum virgatum]|uniref:uncharacterized protein LOC120664083 n=1 Tax=Panicum virgatum TaxID=38727 RepID=UPI0019D4F43E|nr:uncharacterized protein LOC120664083 [Panicum virgatum]XP_039835022.1 uncharacterized protein LOC120695873 [Panicum virgatum]
MASSDGSSSPGGSSSSSDLDIPLVVTNPAPASQVQLINIKTHVPMVLDFDEANYGPWRLCFLAVFAKFGLLDHVNSSDAEGSSDWVQNDYSIVSWLYCTISNDILRTVQTSRDTAYSLWRAIRGLFRDNKATRSVYVGADFHNVYQGDMSVMAYCSKVKQLADQLRDLGSPVLNQELVITLLRGLNERLHNVIPSITSHKRLPSFLKVRSQLRLEENRVDTAAKRAQAAAFFAHMHGSGGAASATSGASIASGAPLALAAQPGVAASPTSAGGAQPGVAASPTSAGGAGGSGKKQRYKKKNSGGGSSSNNGRPGNASTVQPQWPQVNPWSGTFQAWPTMARPPLPPPGTGVLGPRPGVPLAQAYYGVAPMQQPQAPSWDQAALIAALNNMALQTSPAGDWVMDTGASTHMSNHGSAHQDGNSPM